MINVANGIIGLGIGLAIVMVSRIFTATNRTRCLYLNDENSDVLLIN
jgi:hypothetical protein